MADLEESLSGNRAKSSSVAPLQFQLEGGVSQDSLERHQKANKCATVAPLIIFPILIVAVLVVQVLGYVKFDNPMIGGFVSIGSATIIGIGMYVMFFAPQSQTLLLDKKTDSLRVVYHLRGGNRQFERSGKLSKVQDIELQTIRS